MLVMRRILAIEVLEYYSANQNSQTYESNGTF